jgi:hypothetical protein
MKIKMIRKCGYCGNEIDWVKEFLEWVKNYGEDWIEFAMMMIICYECENYVGEIDLAEGEVETEEVESPALKSKVAVPKDKPKMKN